MDACPGPDLSIPFTNMVVLFISFPVFHLSRGWAKRFTFRIPLKAHSTPMLIIIFPIFKDVEIDAK